MASPISRRRFLELVPTILAAAPAFAHIASQRGIETFTAATRAGLAGVFAQQHASAVAIGRRYLHQCPGEDSCDALLDLVLRDLPVDGPGALPPGDILSSVFRDRFADDFERGETVTVDGWVLSRTEARLCAISALS